jgi:hypothetical protein
MVASTAADRRTPGRARRTFASLQFMSTPHEEIGDNVFLVRAGVILRKLGRENAVLLWAGVSLLT